MCSEELAAAAKSRQSCPTLQPYRRQPTRLPCPWDSPGKNTGVGCHFLLQYAKVKVKSLSRIRLLVTPWTTEHQAPPSMGFRGKSTGVGCHFLLQYTKVKVKSLSRVQLLGTPWTAAYQAPPSMDFSGKSTGVGCHCLLPIEKL